MTNAAFDITQIRADFPILKEPIKGKSLVYLDSGSSALKPIPVIEKYQRFSLYEYSNVNRSPHSLGEAASRQFEKARDKVRQFIHARQSEEIVFTRGTTEAINLVAQSYLKPRLKERDEILISQAEHHANIVPWQQLCEQTGSVLKVIPINEDGSLQLEKVETLLSERTRLVAITHLSNVLGILNPIQAVIKKAHQYNVPVLIDGAQAVAHLPVDVASLDCDFYTFSGHKLYGPNGVGILYGKMEHLESMPPWQSGGGMIHKVTFQETTYAPPPYRFEAGTPAIAEVIALGATVDYMQSFDWKSVMQHEASLFDYLLKRLQKMEGVKILAEGASDRMVLLSLVMDRVHPHDIATILDEEGIAVRAGHHCAMPLMEFLQVPATLRVSLGIYNTYEEVDALIKGLHKVSTLLS